MTDRIRDPASSRYGRQASKPSKRSTVTCACSSSNRAYGRASRTAATVSTIRPAKVRASMGLAMYPSQPGTSAPSLLTVSAAAAKIAVRKVGTSPFARIAHMTGDVLSGEGKGRPWPTSCRTWTTWRSRKRCELCERGQRPLHRRGKLETTATTKATRAPLPASEWLGCKA